MNVIVAISQIFKFPKIQSIVAVLRAYYKLIRNCKAHEWGFLVVCIVMCAMIKSSISQANACVYVSYTRRVDKCVCAGTICK